MVSGHAFEPRKTPGVNSCIVNNNMSFLSLFSHLLKPQVSTAASEPAMLESPSSPAETQTQEVD